MNSRTLFISLFLVAVIFNHPVQAETGEKTAQRCFGCHGTKGNSSNSMFPILAGQQAAYIRNQLNAFSQDQRENGMMQNIAKNLTAEEIKNLAHFFAQQKPKSAGGDAQLTAAGKKLSSMCLGCHGNKAEGRGQFPRLAGQHAAYLVKQLQNFKQGKRQGGPMPSVAKKLSDQDIKALAAYFASLN